MADGRDDRHRAGGERADEPLVAEREEILEAAAAAGEDDDVDLGRVADLAERLGDRGGGARALDVGLGDEDPGGREARGDRGQHVSLRRGVVARDEPDASRKARQRPLALGREEAFGCELALQALESGEMVAEAEALDREGPEAKVPAASKSSGRPKTWTRSPFASSSRSASNWPRAIVTPRQAPSVGSFSVRKTLCQRVLAAELGHLALDPDGRQAREPVADAAVEGRRP